jgi:hypothetical protein
MTVTRAKSNPNVVTSVVTRFKSVTRLQGLQVLQVLQVLQMMQLLQVLQIL